MQAFVEQQVGIRLDVFPWGEHARLQVGQAEVLVVQHRLFLAMHVVAAFAHAGFAIYLERFFDLVEVVGFRAEVAERIVARLGGLGHGGAERHAIQAVQAVAFDDGGGDLLAAENIFEGAFDGGSACAGRTGHGNHGMFAGHGELS